MATLEAAFSVTFGEVHVSCTVAVSSIKPRKPWKSLGNEIDEEKTAVFCTLQHFVVVNWNLCYQSKFKALSDFGKSSEFGIQKTCVNLGCNKGIRSFSSLQKLTRFVFCFRVTSKAIYHINTRNWLSVNRIHSLPWPASFKSLRVYFTVLGGDKEWGPRKYCSGF